MSDDRLFPDPAPSDAAGAAEPTADAAPVRLSAIERARRAWSRRPARKAPAVTAAARAGAARAARTDPEQSEEDGRGSGLGLAAAAQHGRASTIDRQGSAGGGPNTGTLPVAIDGRGARIDPARSAVGEPGNGVARSNVIRVVHAAAREVAIVELREAAMSPAAAASGESAGGGEAPRRRLRWVGWISRRVFHG